MDEPRTRPLNSSVALPWLPGGGWSDLRCLLLLALVAVGLRGWHLGRTEVAARDSILFIRIAWRLGHEDWRKVIPTSDHHPGYPLAVLALSGAVRQALPDDPVRAMQLSAQLASCLASVLLVLPMFYLGKELFDRGIAFWATLLFQCLPAPARVMPDGLSEALFFLLCATALLFSLRALRTGAPWEFALAGLAGGLAYLTRPEGALIAALTLLVLLALQRLPRWRQPWRRVALCGAALVVASLIVAGPFMVLIQHVTLKPSLRRLVDLTSPKILGRRTGDSIGMASALPVFATWWFERGVEPGDRYGWAAYAVASVTSKGFFYVLWLPALLGLWRFRGRFRTAPGTWILPLVGLALIPGLYRIAQQVGYAGERHVLLIVLGGVYWTVAGLGVLGTWLARLVPRHGQGVTRLLMLAAVLVPLSKTLPKLHGERGGFVEAGRWLAEHTQPGDPVIDPYSWSHYHAGRVFLEGRTDLPAHNPPVCYVVLEQSKNEHLHLWPNLTYAKQLVSQPDSKPVQRFTVHRGQGEAAVVVYEVPRTATP
jgi:hypothetical protein